MLRLDVERMSEAKIRLENVSKRYDDTVAVDDVSLSVADGEFLALLGPSGSGKSTTLRMLAGFEQPSSGTISLDGERLDGVPPHKRDTSMVFQDYALFPHMSVRENVSFGLKRQGVDREEIDRRVDDALDLVDMKGFKDRSPGTLSGGQQQRVATARSLATEPEVLLLDEPLGALDKKLRDQIKVDFARLQDRLDITTVYVTHNQDEALTMADRIAVMDKGHLEQVGTPTEVYESPETRFVSDFIGDANFIEGTLSRRDGQTVLSAHGTELAVADNGDQDTGVVFVRPEKMTIAAEPGEENALTGTVEQVLYVGSKQRYYVAVDGTEYVVDVDTELSFAEGESVSINWAQADTRLVADR